MDRATLSQFKSFLKNRNSKDQDSRNNSGMNCEKIRNIYNTDVVSKSCRSNNRKNPKGKVKCFECGGYGHISSECANTLKKQKNGKNKASNTTWSDSESESENDEKTVALITTVSLDESHEGDHDIEDMNIEYMMKKYDDLVAASQKLRKQNSGAAGKRTWKSSKSNKELVERKVRRLGIDNSN